MDHFLRYPMLCDMFKYFAGDMWCHGLRADENHLIRTGFQIAMDQGLRPIDVIQSLQICLGIGEYNPESPENLEEAMAGCLKYILTSRHEVSTLRRNLGNIASRIRRPEDAIHGDAKRAQVVEIIF